VEVPPHLSATRTSKKKENNGKIAFYLDTKSNKKKICAHLRTTREKAQNIYNCIMNNYPPKLAKQFNVSNGWFHQFKQWQNFHNLKLCGGGGNADEDAASTLHKEFKENY
jgi:hypothetical protein